MVHTFEVDGLTVVSVEGLTGAQAAHAALGTLAHVLAGDAWRIDALGQAPEGRWRIEAHRDGDGALVRLGATTLARLADATLAFVGHLDGPTETCPVCGREAVVDWGVLGVRCVRGCALDTDQRYGLYRAFWRRGRPIRYTGDDSPWDEDDDLD